MFRSLFDAFRRHRLLSITGALVIVGAGVLIGSGLGRDLASVVVPANEGGALPTAPPVDAPAGATVYRIDPAASEVRYEVNETLAGEPNRVIGRTRFIAGELAVATTRPAESRLGEIVIDASRLRSDNRLRDQRLRSSYLESSTHPLVRLRDTTITGLPAQLEQGRDYPLTITGKLVVKDRPVDTTWSGTARVDGGEVRATASTDTGLKALGIGAIHLPGLATVADKVTITVDLVARDGTSYTPPTRLDADTATSSTTTSSTTTPTGSSPSFTNAVRPILEANCASCHQPGEAGAHAFTLATSGDAARVSDGLGLVVRTGYMPPWPASAVGVPLKHVRRLSDEQRKVIADWAAAGGPLDEPADTALTPAPGSARPEPRPDLVLKPEQGYSGDGTTLDDYRCIVLDPRFERQTWVTGVAFRPDQREIVHHSLIYRVPARNRDQILAMNGKDGRPGYTCFGGVSAGSLGGEGLIGGWAPGKNIEPMVEGDGMPFEAGDLIVVQMHYHFGHTTDPDRSWVELQLDDDGLASNGDPLKPIRVRQLVAPVEIPCRAGETAPLCDRAATIKDVEAKYGIAGRIIADGIHAICGTRVEDYANQTTGIGRSSCTHRVGQDGQIVDVLGHMHELGTSFRMTLNPGTPEEKILLDIPRWDFNWQLNYQPVTDVAVKKSDVIKIECTWDKSLRNDEPRYLVFAEGTHDEMCFSTIAVRPERP